MGNTNIFLKIGACLCILIGALYCVVTTQLLVDRAFYTAGDALIIIIYTLVAFVPFIVFFYPRFKTSRKPVLLSAGILEILVIGLFVLNVLSMLGD